MIILLFFLYFSNISISPNSIYLICIKFLGGVDIISKNNNLLIFIPLLLIGANKTKATNSSNVKKTSLDNSIFNSIGDAVNSLTVEDINRSMETLEKIGPYLPEPYIEKVNNLVFNFEKINKANELVSFISKKPSTSSNVSVQNISSKERFNKILLTLKDDMPEEKIKNIRPIIDIIANFDKYKGMIGMISAMNSPSERSEDKMDKMMDMVMPFLSQDEESNDKMKDMMQIFKTIASSNLDNTEKPENEDQNVYEKV